ncbi:hypothetical protein D3C80_810160 [compost metagenome]
MLDKAAVGGARLEHLETCQVEIACGDGGVECRDVDVLHLVPVTGGDTRRRADLDVVLPGALGSPQVQQVVGSDAQVAVGSQQAVAVLHLVGLQGKVLARHQACRCRVTGRGFQNGLVNVDHTALERVMPATVLATLPAQATVDDALAQLEFGLGVFHGRGVEGNRPFALHRARQVAEALRAAAVQVSDTQVTTAVDVTVQVAEVGGAQGHRAAAEQQSVGTVGKGLAGIEVDVALRAQGAAVGDLRGVNTQVLARGQVAQVVERTGEGNTRVGTSTDPPAVLGDVGGLNGQQVLRAEAAAVVQVAGQVQGQVTVAEQLAAVVEVAQVQGEARAAGQPITRQQRQRVTGVGQGVIELDNAQPVDRAEMPVAIAQRTDAAAGAAHPVEIQAQQAGAGMFDAACAVVQRIGFEGEVGAADFDTAALVDEAASQAECAGAVGTGVIAEGAQPARSVVQRTAVQVQRGVGLDQAATVDQVACRERDTVAAQLAAIGVGQRVAGEQQRSFGEQFAGVAGERADVQRQAVDQARQRARLAGIAAVVQRPGADVHCVALDGAADVADGATAQVQPRKAAAAQQRTPAVVQLVAGEGQAATASDKLALLAIAQGAGLQVELAATHAAALVVDSGDTAEG